MSKKRSRPLGDVIRMGLVEDGELLRYVVSCDLASCRLNSQLMHEVDRAPARPYSQRTPVFRITCSTEISLWRWGKLEKRAFKCQASVPS